MPWNILSGRITATCFCCFQFLFIICNFAIPSLLLPNSPYYLVLFVPYKPALVLHHHNQFSLSTPFFSLPLPFSLSFSLNKLTQQHVRAHIRTRTGRAARKARGLQDQRPRQAWPQDPSHYRKVLPRSI